MLSNWRDEVLHESDFFLYTKKWHSNTYGKQRTVCCILRHVSAGFGQTLHSMQVKHFKSRRGFRISDMTF